MKIFPLLLSIPLLGFANIDADYMQGPTRADDITINWLTKDAVPAHDTHHVVLFKKLFQLMKPKTLLEFGVGYPTKFFLDNCNKVISVDFITHGYGPGVMQKFLGIYSEYSNWIPIAFFSGYLGSDYGWAPYKHMASDSVYKATSYQNAHHKNYALIDDFYIFELNAFITNLLKYNKVNVAFTGHAIFIRGDIVQLFFGKVPIIVSANTNNRMLGIEDDIYGLSRVVVPEDYEEIFFALEGGTTVWVAKKPEWKNLIEKLKEFAKEI